jgi:ABC-type branched-subunit amino acid transport system substrate-binding protein
VASGFIFTLLVAASSFLFVCCQPDVRQATVLIISRDQSDTTSLNPSRISVTSDLALRVYNEANTKRVQIRHTFITYTGNDENGVKAAEEYLQTDKNVVAVIGDIGSPTTRLVAEFAGKHQLVHLSFFATEDAIFEKHPWSFSYRSTLKQEHDILFDLLLNRLNARNVVLLKANNQTINPRFIHFKNMLASTYLTIQSEWIYERTTYDFRKDIAKIDWSKADALIVMLAADQTEHYVQQLQLARIRIPIIMTTPSLQSEAFSDMAPITLEMYGLMPAAQVRLAESGDEKFNLFRDRYRTAMGNNRFDSGGFWAYDGFLLLHELLQETRNSEELREALSSYNGNRSVGHIRFNESGILQDTTFTPIRIIDGSYETISL